MVEVKKEGNTNDYVYDISLDGTVVNALGENVLSNTDGFNFQMPTTFRYTDEHPYISDGGGRNSVKGKSYTLVDADVAEFEDTYMNHAFNGGINKNGLGIDEYCNATINFARKNYSDLLDNGKIKMVGNTIKSKKMPIYIEKFMGKAIELLLNGKGMDFLEFYYDYIEKIYNMQIPLKDIATVGKIKTSIENYKEGCKKLTAAGTKKARQAWYELVIRDNIPVNMGDNIYYINTGTKKNTSDVQRITKYYYIDKDGNKCENLIDENGDAVLDKKGNPVNITKHIEKEYTKLKKEMDVSVIAKHNGEKGVEFLKLYDFAKKKYSYLDIKEEDVIVFNCVRLPNEIVEDEDDHFCDSTFEYNRAKYIDMFNKRIKPLLVCFDRKIRTTLNSKGKEVDNILITNPKDRKSFTKEESKLVSGQPYNESDQDSYEQLMTIENKEVKFWLSIGKKPPYVEECGIDWDETVKRYKEHEEELKKESIQKELDEYNSCVSDMKQTDVEKFIETGELPDKLMKLIEPNMETYDLVSKKYGVILGSIYDIIDKQFEDGEEE